MITLQALTYIAGNDQTGGPIWNYATGTLNPGKGVKPDRVIQLNWNESKSIIRNNLGFRKHPETYLIQNFQKHCYRSNGIKIEIWQGKMYQTHQ